MAEKQITALIQLKDYEGRCNVLIPTVTMQQISPYHRIRVEQVKINPDPEAGDVYKVGSKKVGNSWQDVLSLSKTGIMKLAQAAGIVWNWAETRPISVSKDYVLYQAVGAMRKPSGEWIPLKATKEIDLEVIEAETYEANLKTAKGLKPEQRDNMSPEEWAAAKTKANMIQWRKNKLMRAETGAMLRVVRALLGVKHQYSPKELQKPFAVPTVDFAPDYSDPEVRRAMAEAGVRATADLFGQFAVHQLEAPQQQMGPPIDIGQHEESFNSDVVIDAGTTDDEEDDNLPWDDEEATELEEEQASIFDGAIICSDCGQPVEGTDKLTAEQVSEYAEREFGRKLCVNCGRKARAAEKAGGGKR